MADEAEEGGLVRTERKPSVTRHLMEEAMLGGSPENKDAASLRSLKKAELIAEAERLGVAIETDDNREDLIRKIEEAQA